MKKLLHWIGALLLLVTFGSPQAAEPQKVRLETGGHHLVTAPEPIGRVAIADPKVADVQLVSNREVLLYAKKVGVTDLRLWTKAKVLMAYQVVVDAPSAAAREAVAIAGENGLTARSVGAQIRLEGKTDSLQGQVEARRALKAAAADTEVADAATQTFDNQVQTDIKVVEVSRRALMQSGMHFSKNSSNTTISVSGPGTLSGVQSNAAGGFTLESNSGFLPLSQAFNLVAGSAKDGLLGIISLLEGNGFAYTLAEPSLTVMNGQTATFVAGGEIPIPVTTGDNTVTIEYRQYGVRLTLTPTVLDAKRIVIKAAPEVSELDTTTSVTTAGVAVPGFRIRKTETTVQLAEGESFVISGLISRSNTAAIDKVPFLGDLPILGAFFKSSRIERDDKELIMVVTPHLVRAISASAPLPPLPGEAYGRYRPGFAEMLFLESGRFNRLNRDTKE